MDGITGNVNAGYTSLNHTNIGGYFATQFGKLNLSVNYGYSHMSKRETKLDSYIHRRYVESGKTEDTPRPYTGEEIYTIASTALRDILKTL